MPQPARRRAWCWWSTSSRSCSPRPGTSDGRPGEREAFVAALHAAATVPAGPQELPPALVVVAVRADYLGRLIAYPPLKAALDAGLFTVGPMSEAELRLAITGPAAEAGLAVEPAVVEAVIAELREGAAGGLGSGVLPLMSQAMAATWEHREGSRADPARLPACGRGRRRGQPQRPGRLRHPDQPAAGRGPPGVHPADGHHPGWPVRAAPVQQDRSALPGERRWQPTSTRSSTSSAPGACSSSEKDSVEISHDALLQAWKQLRDWLGDDQLDRALYSQVVTDAHTWDINGRDSAYLYRPGRLATIDAAATRWQDAPTRYPPLPATSKAFLGAAHHAAGRSHPPAARRDRRPAGPHRDRRQPPRRIRDAANASRQAANASRQHAIALSRQLAAESLAIDSGDPLTARRLAVAAWRVFPTDQAGSAMTGLLMEQQQDGILPGDPSNGGVSRVAFSPDGHLLAAAYGDGMCGCGTRSPGRPPGLLSRLIPVRAAA